MSLDAGSPRSLPGRGLARFTAATQEIASWARSALRLTLFLTVVGCQTASPLASRRLIEHRATVDFSGLETVQVIDELKVLAARPQQWSSGPIQTSALYTHEQWRSPSHCTGVGIAYVHMPFPLSAGFVVWFARNQYTQRSADGRLIREWGDAAGRQWFEAENRRYHVQGYVLTRGMDAWIVYCGYKVAEEPVPQEISLAQRCADAIVPLPLLENDKKQTIVTAR